LQVLKQSIATLESLFDRLRYRLLPDLDKDSLMIQPYIGYATHQKIYLRGRVMDDEGIPETSESDSRLRNLLNLYRRFETDEIPGAVVSVTFDPYVVQVTADEEGYFEVDIPLEKPLPPDQREWTIELALVSAPRHKLGTAVRTKGTVIAPANHARFGVISDLDDTVLQSDVLDHVKLLRNTLFENARTRLPFTGVSGFYRALQVGDESVYNPIFYVSSSPWNLYDVIIEFLEVQKIPTGPLFLQDFGISPSQFITSEHDEHKLHYIRQLLEDYPEMPFILIGDSGQRDPEIYQEIVSEYPEHILAVYIRDVTLDARDAEIAELAATTAEANVDLLLVPDTLAAAQHAYNHDWISEAGLKEVEQAFAVDQVKEAQEEADS
jgi:phosphatidate phosphatase APP1